MGMNATVKSNQMEVSVFDRIIGRVGGMVFGVALIAAAVFMATNQKPEGHRRVVRGRVDGQRAYESYQQRTKAAERMLLTDRVYGGGF